MNIIEMDIPGYLDLYFSEELIDRRQMMAVAFSGGSDSLALLHALAGLIQKDSVEAFYVNHHLRPEEELESEIARNRENCRIIGVRFTVLDLKAVTVAEEARQRGRGIEEAARLLRYEALSEACREREIPYLLTAHNSDDQLETLLMRIGQGSSLSALGGIRRRRDLGGVELLRPLLETSHGELEAYVAEKGLVWSQDSTNREGRYLRNALRHEVKKPLLALFPNARYAAYVLTTRFTKVSRLLETLTDEAMEEVGLHDDVVAFSLRWYYGLDPVLQELAIYRIAAHLLGGGERISRNTYSRIAYGLDEFIWGTLTAYECDGLRMTYTMETVIISVIEPVWSYCIRLVDPTSARSIAISEDHEIVIRKNTKRARDPNALQIDASSLNNPVIRSAIASDEIALEGGTMRVGKLLSSMGITRHQRPSVPVLVDQSGVVAVFGAAFGGRDRLAVRFKAPLAHGFTNIYSSKRRDIYSEDE